MSIRPVNLLLVMGCLMASVSNAQQVQSVSSEASVRFNSLDSILKPSTDGVIRPAQRDQISLVRESVLKDLALIIGAQAGLSDRSREILAVLDKRQKELDKRFQFNRLVLGQNVLPPSISESRDVVALEASAMRVAGVVYRIDEPARFALPTPTWRDWLYLGLDINPPQPQQIDVQVLPQTPQEQAYWERMVRQGYEAGREQAQASFDANLNLLERSYSGMRRFYELVQRGMVTPPVIASATEIMQREDPHTVSVGNTIFRITAGADFAQPVAWTPLE